MNQFDLAGRHAVITGSAAGLGFAIAGRLLASGASVTLWDLDSQALARAAGELGEGVHTAVIALTKSLGKELADTGVRVNCVTPAAVKTAIFEQMSPEHIAFMLSKIPMGRFGTPEEVAAMVGWLCTEECSFSTGAVFDLLIN
jgi:NAD(P)-dependent dehydrogenase (short-subunit alcohol dehydrogenase family)